MASKAKGPPWWKEYNEKIRKINTPDVDSGITAQILFVGIMVSALSFLAAFSIRDFFQDMIDRIGKALKIHTVAPILTVFLVFLLTFGFAFGGIIAVESAKTNLNKKKRIAEVQAEYAKELKEEKEKCNKILLDIQKTQQISLKEDIKKPYAHCHNIDVINEHIRCAKIYDDVKDLEKTEIQEALKKKNYNLCYNKEDIKKLLQ